MSTRTRRILFAALTLLCLSLFAVAAHAQAAPAQSQSSPTANPPQQPGSMANPAPGDLTQERVAEPGNRQTPHEEGGEAALKLPDLSTV